MQKELLIDEFFLTNKLPLNIEKSDEKIFSLLKSPVKFPAVYLYHLTNAYISPYGMVFKNGLPVNEAIYDAHQNLKNIFTFYKKILRGKVKRTEGNCVVIHNSWYDNYYHWCTEALPRLFVLKNKVKEINLILPVNLKPFHKQTLEYFDLKSITYCHEDELIFSPVLYFSSFTAPGFGVHNPDLIKGISSFIKSKNASPGNSGFSRNIYTSRSATAKRQCINEDELITVLKKFDFETIIPDNLSLKQQIELFGQSKNVLGVHGSSFVNCLYMKRGSVIFDLIENDHNDFCFLNMASALDVNYVYIRSKGVGDPADFRNNNILVDVKNLERLLDKYLCR
jgi:hypothetical protein